MTQGIYWKEEDANRLWKFIPDTDAARKEAINNGAMFFTTMALSEPYRGNGQPEPVRFGDFPLDFDSKSNPEKALQDLRALCLVHLTEFYDVEPHDIKFYCSGGKGFHAVLPKAMFGMEKGDPYLPMIYKRIVTDWVARFELSTIDLSMYAMKKGKMFRIENVKRANGRYKVPLTLEEVRDLPISQLLKLSERPRDA